MPSQEGGAGSLSGSTMHLYPFCVKNIDNHTPFVLTFLFTLQGVWAWIERDPMIIRDPVIISYLRYNGLVCKRDPALIETRLLNGHIQ